MTSARAPGQDNPARAQRPTVACFPGVEEQHLVAKVLDPERGEAAALNNALAGVAARSAVGFGFVVGVDRVGHGDERQSWGADRVMTDRAPLLDLVAPA